MRNRPEYDFKVIGSNLKALRLANDLTVEEVRDYMQLGSVQAVYKWERGDGLPQADTLIALMDLYGENRIGYLGIGTPRRSLLVNPRRGYFVLHLSFY